MVGWARRCCVAGGLAVLCTGVVVGHEAVEATAPAPAVDVVGAVPAPLGVSGRPVGEELNSAPLPDDVLLEPPSDAVVSDESLEERLDRERTVAARPSVTGFDEKLSREDPTLRSANGSVFDNPDGTSTMVIESGAVHYQVDGRWEKIDPRVVEVDGGWETKASDHVVRFSADGIVLRSDKGEVSWAPTGVALPEPVVANGGLTVTYPDVWPGSDLRYVLSNDAVKEEIVVSSPGAVPADGLFAFDVSGGDLVDSGEGRVSVDGAFGTEVSFGRWRCSTRQACRLLRQR
jgi:hypothetical protein